MPATSKSQQRLMAQAYAIKTGKMKPEDLDPKYKTQIMDLANSMKEEDLKDYAETPHTGLPDVVKEDEIPMFEAFIAEGSGKIEKRHKIVVTSSVKFYIDDSLWSDNYGSDKELAEMIVSDLNLKDGDIDFERNYISIEGKTLEGKSISIYQDGEFDMYGGPYTPKMKKPKVVYDGKDIYSSVRRSFDSYGWERKEEVDISRTDIWGALIK
jgi:hypothetical protein